MCSHIDFYGLEMGISMNRSIVRDRDRSSPVTEPTEPAVATANSPC